MQKNIIFSFLLLVQFFYSEVKGAENALIWKEENGLHYCLVADEWEDGKKLKLKLGNCCYYNNKMKYGRSTKRIKKYDNSFCLRGDKLGDEFSIIPNSGTVYCSII